MECIRGFLNQRRILVLLLVLLAVSMALNACLYFNLIKHSSYEYEQNSYEYEQTVHMSRVIQAGMGQVGVSIDNGLWVGVGREFNVSAGIGLWEPNLGSQTFCFTFRLYERALHGEYSNTPIAEKNVTVQKHKDEMYVSATAILNVTAPPDAGIYIYQVRIYSTGLPYTFEFPMLVEGGGRIDPFV